MRIASTLALALALGGVAAATPAAAREKKDAAAPKYTPAVQNAAAAAQTALKANDLATAQAKVTEAKNAVQNDDDRYVVGTLEYQIAQQNKDQALLADGVDMMVASNKADAATKPKLLMAQGQIAYQANNFPKAVTSLQAAQAAGATDANLVPLIVTAMAKSGQTAQALNALNEQIDKAQAAGQTVPAEWYQQGISIGYNAKGAADMPAIAAATTTLTKKWVAAYPTKSNWHDAMAIYINQNKLPTDVQVDVFRLERAAGALGGDAEYREYAEDVYLRNPNEAKGVLEEGIAKGIVNASNKDATEVLGLVRPKIAADQASLASSDKASRAAANGKAALSTADGYVSYGQYDKAVELYKIALQKGQVDEPTVNLHMGWALALKGDAAGAKQAFGAVTGLRKTIADYWVIHLDHPTQG